MKKLILSAVVVLGAALTAAAGPFQVGPVVGMNINSVNLSGDLASNFSSDNRCGFAAGVMAKFTVPIINIGVDLSALYEYRSNKFSAGDIDETPNYSYIAVPVHVRYDIPMPVVSQVIYPTIFTGPNFAFNVGKDKVDNFKATKCDIGWDFGVGITLIQHLQISAAYTLGITKTVTFVGDYAGYDLQSSGINGKTSGWTVSAAYLF